MNYYILALSLAFFINLIIYIIVSKMYKTHEDLGRFKVTYNLHSIKYFRALTTTYFMEIDFQGKKIRQTISKAEFFHLQGYTEEYVYIRKFPKKFFNPNLAEYEFKLDEKSWQTIDKEKSIKGFIFMFLAFSLFITIIYFDLQNY